MLPGRPAASHSRAASGDTSLPSCNSQPLATGLYTPTRLPAVRNALAISAPTYVFPTPVPVPVMKIPSTIRFQYGPEEFATEDTEITEQSIGHCKFVICHWSFLKWPISNDKLQMTNQFLLR